MLNILRASEASREVSGESILDRVRKPGRYINREWNAVHKDQSQVEVKIALAYPDAYEVGLSNLGFSILYGLLNERKDVLAERVYAPWTDMEEEMRKAGISLFALESGTSLSSFDIVGFTLQYEMNFTNILTMLSLAGIPFKSVDRGDDDPLIIGGGPCAFNPEPLASFFDAFVIGEGEEVVLELVEAYRNWQARLPNSGGQGKKESLLADLAKVKGVYVPSLYQVGEDAPVEKRMVADLNRFSPPTSPTVPYIEVIHDRYALEIMRGCTRSCRFCQAGMIYRPVRERSAEVLKACAMEGLKNTGCGEVSLVSLSSTDYSEIVSLSQDLARELVPKGIAISLPSLRIDAFSVEVANEIKKSKQSSLTFAPEAGSQRLRNVINKGATEEDLLETTRTAFQSGWRKLKLYFMIGLPTETEEDLNEIVFLAKKVVDLGLSIVPREEHRRIDVTINASPFIPKAHTPFQWAPQDSLEVLQEKLSYLRSRLRQKHLIYKWHDPQMSKVEAAIARGDRRLSEVIEKAWQLGCRFDSWSEQFDFDKWGKAFQECGLEMESYSDRERKKDEALPWEHIDSGVKKDFLLSEYEKAMEGELTEDCRFAKCVECGVC